jgi:hypothetical protein
MTDSGAKANRSEVIRASTLGLYLFPRTASDGRCVASRAAAAGGSRGADGACRQASLLGSPTGTEWVDWGLALNTQYWCRVTAVDRAGNESPPTAAVQASTPRFEPVRISLKPLEARLENLAVAEKPAAGGPVICRQDAAGADKPGARVRAVATWQFDVPRDGRYAIWGRSTYQKDQPSTFALALDDQPKIVWRAWGVWGKWLWSPAGDRVAGSPQVFALKAGTHTLRVLPQTPTAAVAELVVTDDPTWWPVEAMRSDRR